VKTLVMMLGFVLSGTAFAQNKHDCTMPIYIDATHGTAHNAIDTTGKLFVYALEQSVRLHTGACLVNSLADAKLQIIITTVQIINGAGPSDSSVVAVVLTLPVEKIPLYLNDYVLIIEDAKSVDGQVDNLLNSIGKTLDRLGSHA